MSRRAILLGAAWISTVPVANAAGGAQIIEAPIEGEARQCVNRSTDSIWLDLRGAKVEKKSKFFRTDREIALVIDTEIAGKALKTGGGEDPASFQAPRMARANVEDYDAGSVWLPIRLSLVTDLPLTTDQSRFDRVGFDFTLVRKKKKQPWADVFDSLLSASSSFAIPGTPFAQGLTFFQNFSDSALNKALQNEDAANKVPQGKIDMVFSPDGVCTGQFQKTGTIAVVFAPPAGSTLVGHLRPDELTEERTCFRSNAGTSGPTRIVYAGKLADGTCPAKSSDYKPLRNDFYSFVLNAVSKVPKATTEKVIEVPDAPTNGFNPLWAPKLVDDLEELRTWVADVEKVGGLLSSIGYAKEDAPVIGKLVNVAILTESETIPFGKTEKLSTRVFKWSGTRHEGIALDISQSLVRCARNKITPEACFQ